MKFLNESEKTHLGTFLSLAVDEDVTVEDIQVVTEMDPIKFTG